MPKVKIAVTCNHMCFDGQIVREGEEIEIEKSLSKNILDADELLNRKPRIEVLKTRKPRGSNKPAVTDTPVDSEVESDEPSEEMIDENTGRIEV